jgi:hypothetical protein
MNANTPKCCDYEGREEIREDKIWKVLKETWCNLLEEGSWTQKRR